MIPLEKQVTSLELSKKLDELAVKEKSYWCWKKMKSNKARDDYFLSSWDMENRDLHAYTVAELGEILPLGAYSTHIRTIQKGVTRWTCTSGDAKNFIEAADTEADARAKMLIWLIKNKFMEANK